jgi:hypothetical protein
MKSPWSLFGALLFGAAFSTFAQAASFTACKDSLSFQELNGSTCAVFHAPLRAPGPQTGGSPETVDLFVRKFPAHGHAKGSLWLISGGPGESGSTFYPFLKTLRAILDATLYQRRIGRFARRNGISWRGMGHMLGLPQRSV